MGAPNGPISCALQPEVDDDLRGAFWQPDEGTGANVCFLSVEDYAALLDDRLYVNVHTVDQPSGAIRGNLRLVPTLDGDLTDAQYQTLATERNGNSGFSQEVNVDEIVYYADPESEVLFLGVVGHIPENGSSDGIALWLDFNQLAGAPAGTALGQDGIGAAHYLSGDNGSRLDFEADFEVDYLFAVESAGTADQVFLHGMSLVGTPVADFIGTTDLTGTAVLGPEDEVNNVGGAPLFSQNNVAFAFSNAGYWSDGGTDPMTQTGLEMAIPFNQLGLDAAGAARLTAGDFRAFAIVSSNTAYFSDVSVPGDIAPGNIGFSPDFLNNLRDPDGFGDNAGGIIGDGPFSSAFAELPVELTAFGAVIEGGALRVEWSTAGETNNAYFDVALRAAGESAFRDAGQVAGAGTTAEPQRYALPVTGLQPGRYTVRLTQVDLDGATSALGTVEVAVGVAGTHALSAVTPNPSMGTARASLTVGRAQAVEVTAYDVLGRRVQTLFSGAMDEGEARQFEVDASALAPGLYVIRAQGEGFVETTRFTVVR